MPLAMMRKIGSISLLLATVLCACSNQSMISKVPSARDSATVLFANAENFYKNNSYEKALKAYKEYLIRHHNNPDADMALMRVAAIYSKQGRYDLKVAAYQRLVSEFPNSRFVSDAMLEILVSLYNEGKFKDVILKSPGFIDRSNSDANLSRIYAILGDTYMSLDFHNEAVSFYHIAFQKALSPEKEEILVKINTVISQLSAEDLSLLLMGVDNESLRSYLHYQLGVYQFDKQNYTEASKLLSEFIEKFPNHEKAKHSKILIENIQQRTDFERYRIGCLLPLSGPYATFGKRALRSVELALDQYNFRLGRSKYQIIVKDTGSNQNQAIEALKHLDAERVALVIGPVVTSEAVAHEAQKRAIPIITMTQKVSITEIGDYVFRNFLTPEMQVNAIVPFAVENLGIERFAILYPDENYGNTFMELFREEVLGYGAEITGMESYRPDQTDFFGPISKLAKIDIEDWRSDMRHRRHKKDTVVVDFDAVFIPDSSEKAGLIAPQFAFYDIDDVLFLGTNLWHSDRLINEAGKYVQYAIMADGFYAGTTNEKINNFIMTFKDHYGENPGVIEAFAYDTAMIAFETLNNSKVNSREGLKEELRNLRDFDGVTGATSFKKNGDAEKKLYLLQIEGNRFVELKVTRQ
jgi:ABC-type branched-subunit amino acid transport system substrate-binding protein/predicted negative regulator of RcsB-dependent stress response